MASPSRAEIEAQWVAMVTLLNEARKFGNVNATNWVTLQDTYEQLYEGDFVTEQGNGVSQARAGLASLLSAATAGAMHDPLLRSYVRAVVNGNDISDPGEMLNRIFQHMIDNSYTVKSRDFTFATPSAAGANVGNGSFIRLNKDEYDYPIENQHVDAKVARCLRDQNSGTGIGEEEFELYGQAPGADGLQVSGSGRKKAVYALSARNSIMSNPSFDQLAGTITAPTDITSWTSSVTVNATNYQFDETNYYRKFQGTTPRALQMNVTSTLTQKLSTFNIKLRGDVPYMVQLSWNRQVGAASGTLQVDWGSKNNSVVAAAQTGWQQLRVPSTIGTNCWLKNFNENDLDLVISWTRTAGTLLIDDLLVVPGTQFDGGWLWILGGSTAFLKNDKWTYTDTATDAGLINYWLWRARGRYLPAVTGGAHTWSGS